MKAATVKRGSRLLRKEAIRTLVVQFDVVPCDVRRYHNMFQRQLKKTAGRLDKAQMPIQFNLTFEEWLSIWLESGQIENRGVKAGQYIMSRHGDLGPYEVGNVAIKLHSQNSSEGNKGKVVAAETVEKRKATIERNGTKSHFEGKQPKASCVNCRRSGGLFGMRRNHFEKCRFPQVIA
jgi:hypothetical protein